MKKIMIGLCLVAFAGFVHAQGLEGLIIEKYYVSNSNDATISSTEGGGTLPAGSVTWRFYADLLPGYTLQAVYGVDAAPAGSFGPGDHELRLETSTTFFNNEDRCGITANEIQFNNVDDNTVMLDSWVSMGAAADDRLGIPKSDDDGVNTIVNNDGALQNNVPSIETPLTTEDGFYSGTTAPEVVTFVGFTDELNIFDCTSQGGSLLSTYNASWASLNSATGADSENNVLFAQLTTDGVLSYIFNLQVGTPSGETENYVAQDAVADEILMPMLKGTLNECPFTDATQIRPTRVTLVWDPTDGATGYQIQGGEVGFGSINFNSGSGTSLVATGLDEGKCYYWRVRATAGGIFGPWSCYDTFWTCSPPVNLHVTNLTNKSATLNWEPGVENATYTVAGRQHPGGPGSVVTINAGTNLSINATGLSTCQNYVWSVYATCHAGSTTNIADPNYFTTGGCKGDLSGVEFSASDIAIEIIPNPATDYAKILIVGIGNQSNIAVDIFDMSGKSIASYSLANATYMSQLDINTSEFATGVYQVVTTTEDYTDVKKLVISN